MQTQESSKFFDQTHAAEYDQRFARLAPFRDSLHLLIGSVFSELPTGARVLCVGVGTGTELLSLAEKYPGWSFTAVEPSAPMLAICRRRVTDAGIASRCIFHEGYLDSLPAAEPFAAATSLLVSHFILSRAERTAFFRGIVTRLRPGGILASADLAADVTSEAYASLLEVWLRLMKAADLTSKQIEELRTAYDQHVAILPPAEVSSVMVAAGFENPILFLQTGLIHAWYARNASSL
jgi:tRNA (cmo5U34)-methyltransferase